MERSDIKILKEIYRNQVFLAERNEKKLIIKKISPKYLALNEIKILKTVCHSYIVQMLDSFEGKDHTFILYEYYPCGNLYEKLCKEGPLSEMVVKKYILQLGSAVDYLHENQIIHRDIKPDNILLDLDDNIKLCDFGLSIITDDFAEDVCGTIFYMAPEVVDAKMYDNKIDLWCIGVLVYELTTAKLPFYHDKNSVVCKYIREKEPDYPEILTADCIDFIQSLLNKNSERRPTAKQIPLHNWFL